MLSFMEFPQNQVWAVKFSITLTSSFGDKIKKSTCLKETKFEICDRSMYVNKN
jgi:hypothetical protein